MRNSDFITTFAEQIRPRSLNSRHCPECMRDCYRTKMTQAETLPPKEELKGGFSILIPTYDFVCYPLVRALHEQAEALGVEYEILVAEDGSRQQDCVVANLKINDLPHCRHIRRTENVGRAAIRNFLANEARGQWFLFIDCDAKVEKSDFLSAYLAATSSAPVIAGGLYHAASCADPHRALRFRYEKEADKHRCAAERSTEPYMQFSTFNFLIRSDVFRALRFDEHCRDYGFEDTLFGLTLQRRGIPILHIDNALLHTGIDTNTAFLTKTETALRTLASLPAELRNCSRVHSLFARLQQCLLAPILRGLYRLLGPCLRKRLEKSAKPSLRLFAFYKLLYYAQLHPSLSSLKGEVPNQNK